MSDAVSRLRQEIAVHDSMSDDMCDQFRNDIEAVCDEIEQLKRDLALLRPVCSADSGGMVSGKMCPTCKGNGLVTTKD